MVKYDKEGALPDYLEGNYESRPLGGFSAAEGSVTGDSRTATAILEAGRRLGKSTLSRRLFGGPERDPDLYCGPAATTAGTMSIDARSEELRRKISDSLSAASSASSEAAAAMSGLRGLKGASFESVIFDDVVGPGLAGLAASEPTMGDMKTRFDAMRDAGFVARENRTICDAPTVVDDETGSW